VSKLNLDGWPARIDRKLFCVSASQGVALGRLKCQRTVLVVARRRPSLHLPAPFSKAMVIMAASMDRVGDPCQAFGNGAGDRYVHSGRLTLPGVQFRVRSTRPAREQCAVRDVACPGVEFIGRGDVVEKRLYQQRGDCRDSRASILAHSSVISALMNPVVRYMRGLFLLD